jgi:hypothetical protein
MNNKDNVGNKTKSANVKLKHMFQSSEEDYHNGLGYIPDTLDLENQNKIALKFKSINQNDSTLLDSVKKMIKVNESDPTKSLLDYIDDLKNLYSSASGTVAHKEVVEHVNISDIITQAEKDLLNQKDQKTILLNLINEINSTTINKHKFEDDCFEQNMTELGHDLVEEDVSPTVEVTPLPINQVEPDVAIITNTNEQNNVKSKKPLVYAFLLFVIIGISIISFLYLDQIIDFFS